MKQAATSHPGQPYWEKVRDHIPRLISILDREPFSQTYGSMDRTWWGWKFTDFPGARFQEGMYSLAFLYTQEAPENTLLGHERVWDWLNAAFDFWCGIQYPDGSFDEAYPFERSLAATAFTLFYGCEAYLLVADQLEPKRKSRLQKTINKAGHWLCRNDETHGLLTNHLAAAAAGLRLAADISDQPLFKERCQYYLDRIYNAQSEEGWYEEYGGADPGYQTHATFYLARIWELDGDDRLLNSIRKSVDFLIYCLHPDGTLGGEYGSRNTEFAYPAGFEMLSQVLPSAACVASFLRPAVETQSCAGLAAMDPYNFFPILNNYLFAWRAAQPLNAPPQPPFTGVGEQYFPLAGFLIRNTSAYTAVLGLSKGGVLKVFDKKRKQLAVGDCGYWARFGKVLSSSQGLQQPANTNTCDGGVRVSTNFRRIKQKVFNPWLFLGFRLFSLTAGRLPFLALKLKHLLVKVLVTGSKSVPLTLDRMVIFEEEEIRVKDVLRCKEQNRPSFLKHEPKFSAIHMGSSRYFQYQELYGLSGNDENLSQYLKKKGVLQLERRIVLGGVPSANS